MTNISTLSQAVLDHASLDTPKLLLYSDDKNAQELGRCLLDYLRQHPGEEFVVRWKEEVLPMMSDNRRYATTVYITAVETE